MFCFVFGAKSLLFADIISDSCVTMAQRETAIPSLFVKCCMSNCLCFYCNSFSGMGEWKVLKCCGSEGQRVVLQPLWILWISKVHRRLTMLSTRWEIGIFGLTTMNLGQCLVLFGALKTAPPRAVETLRDSLGEQLVQCLAHLFPFTPERDVMNGE